MEKFNYQIVFTLPTFKKIDYRVIITGVTELKPDELISVCKGLINFENFELESAIENIVYQPVNLEKGDSK